MNESNKIKIFNSPLEIALRILLIISNNDKKGLSLDRLVIYDYLILNSGDIEGAPPSLHPALPYRSTQLLVKRELIQKALLILSSKELLTINYASEGILYCSSELSLPFLKYFDSTYFLELNERVKWVVANFKRKSNENLDKFISTNLNKWGSEFVNESYIREELHYE